MEFLSNFFNLIFFKPFLNLFALLINILPSHSAGLAIIILTIFVKFIIFPFQHRALVTQKKIKEIAPEIKKIKEKYKNNSQEQAKKTMELYRAHGINPLSSFVVILIQLPIFIALYKIFLSGINFDPNHLYSFIKTPSEIKINFLGLFDLTQKSHLLAGLAALSQFFQMKLAMPPLEGEKKKGQPKNFKEELARNMSFQAKYIMPFFVYFIASRFASALSLYWTTMNLFAIIHESIVRRKTKAYGRADKNN